MTTRLDIIEALLTELNTDRPTGVPEVTGRRFVPGQVLTGTQLSAFLVEQKNRVQRGRGARAVMRDLIVAVQAVAAVEDPADADAALEPLLGWVNQVMGFTTLGSRLTDIEEIDITWAADAADLFRIAAVQRWRLEFKTDRNAT